MFQKWYLLGVHSYIEKDTSNRGLELLQADGTRYYPGVSASFPAGGTKLKTLKKKKHK